MTLISGHDIAVFKIRSIYTLLCQTIGYTSQLREKRLDSQPVCARRGENNVLVIIHTNTGRLLHLLFPRAGVSSLPAGRVMCRLLSKFNCCNIN
jgi:hypothetical protein